MSEQTPYAPLHPSIALLEARYPLHLEGEAQVALGREQVDSILAGRRPGMVGILGPCAMTGASRIIRGEGAVNTDANRTTPGLMIVHRMPPWEPRSNPADWHGLETTEPELAYRTIIDQANAMDAVSIEIAHEDHLKRYEKALTLGWFGGRNIGKADFMRWTATTYPMLPLAIKNGLSGDIQPAIELAGELRDRRGTDGASAVLLYRGGENAKDPETWERQYRQALEATNGRMIVDIAHGTEMAHHPIPGSFKKSVAGQEAALAHIIHIAEEYGELPIALMAEASQAYSPTDPHMSHRIALDGVRRLHALTMQRSPISL